MDAVDEIKDRLSVDDVIGGYVQLKRAGHNLKANCPFHEERTPSFVVSPEKGVYHCFGCGEGGDMFTFVQRMDGLDFPQALERLAGQAGVELEPNTKDTKNRSDYKQTLKRALTAAGQYYHIQLGRSDEARTYVMEKRGFAEETIRDFQLGFAPDGGDRLVKFLRKQGFEEQHLMDAGLVRRSSGKLQDMFRGRIMVPFFDMNGQIIGFTGRALGDFNPKYLNTPQTRLFDKSRFVFGLYQAKDAIRSRDEAVIVEGNLDVVQSHQASVGYVVAMSGTALTQQQIKQLGRFTSTITFAFDADSAGMKATERALPLVQEAGVDLHIVTLPAGKDPDDIIRDNPGVWRELLDDKEYVMDWLLKQLAESYDTGSASGKRQLTDRAATVLRRLRDPVEQEHYIQQLADLVGAAPATITRKLTKPDPPRAKTPDNPRTESSAQKHTEEETVLTALLSLVACYPDTRPALKGLELENVAEPARAVLLHLQSSESRPNPDNLPEELHEQLNYVNILLLRGEEAYGDWSALDRQVEAFSLSHRLNELNTKRKQNEITRQIAAADAAGDTQQRNRLLAEYNKLNE